MTSNMDLANLKGSTFSLAVAASLAACSGQPTRQDAGHLGYGTPGVSSYVSNGEPTSLQALLDRCRQVPRMDAAVGQTEGLPAACGQLHRTLRNQPGNAAQSARTP